MTQGRAILGVAGLLALLIALPLALRQDTTQLPTGGARRLVILTPHGESIRREFAESFARDWQRRTGEAVYIDWRSPGGTSEIRMVLDAGYKAAEEEGRAGVGIDLLFGGGAPDFEGQDRLGRLERLRVLDTHPEWFAPGGPIPATFTGERYVAEKGSLCVDGVSLTVNELADGAVRLNLVPHTAASTRLGSLRAGAAVNLEVDIIAKYVERLMGGDRRALDVDTLRKWGYPV